MVGRQIEAGQENVVRKSFDINENELQRARQCAHEQGVSLAAYIRQAVISRNDGVESSAAIDAAAKRLDALVDRVDRDMTQLRLDLLEQEEARGRAALSLHEQAAADNRDLLIKSIKVMGEHIASILQPVQPKTGSGRPAGPGSNSIIPSISPRTT